MKKILLVFLSIICINNVYAAKNIDQAKNTDAVKNGLNMEKIMCGLSLAMLINNDEQKMKKMRIFVKKTFPLAKNVNRIAIPLHLFWTAVTVEAFRNAGKFLDNLDDYKKSFHDLKKTK